jgi:preprotein translocase subunit Sec63
MYALSYRWWDSWKEYTEKHASTMEVQEFVNKVRETIA